jgi:hypothetical protein
VDAVYKRAVLVRRGDFYSKFVPENMCEAIVETMALTRVMYLDVQDSQK